MAKNSKVLATDVHIDGKVYAAGTTPPADVAERISNPKSWRDADAGDAAEPVAAGDSITAYGSVGEPVGPPPAGSPAAANLTTAADGPPDPPKTITVPTVDGGTGEVPTSELAGDPADRPDSTDRATTRRRNAK
jgi:hypothetical protein